MAALFGSRIGRIALLAGALAAMILLFMAGQRRAGERAGALAERLAHREVASDVQARMLEAAADRPDRDAVIDRLSDGRF